MWKECPFVGPGLCNLLAGAAGVRLGFLLPPGGGCLQVGKVPPDSTRLQDAGDSYGRSIAIQRTQLPSLRIGSRGLHSSPRRTPSTQAMDVDAMLRCSTRGCVLSAQPHKLFCPLCGHIPCHRSIPCQVPFWLAARLATPPSPKRRA